MRKCDAQIGPAKHEEKRREVLDAAETCFVRAGIRGASISEISAEAKMSSGHIYHYFPSKEAIVAAMAAVGMDMRLRSSNGLWKARTS